MAVRSAEAVWNGTLREGNGRMKFGSYEGRYSFSSRFEEGEGTNPEELIGAAHAGCYSMALSGALHRAGFSPEQINTQAQVHLGKVDEKMRITRIHLITRVKAPAMDDQQFHKIAEEAKHGCPVSNALAGVEITLEAQLA